MTEAYRVHGYAAARTRTGRRVKPSPVVTLTVDRRVWREALRVAEGDVSRITIVSATRVVVR